MRTLARTVLAFGVLLGVAVATVNAAEGHPALRPYIHPVSEVFRDLIQVDAVWAVARDLVAWPASEPDGAGAGRSAERSVTTQKRSVAAQEPPAKLDPKPKVVQLPPVVNPPRVHEGWMVVCRHGAYHVPREVYETKAVCDDPSLGVRVEEGYKLGWEGIDRRVAEIRARYLAEQAARRNDSDNN